MYPIFFLIAAVNLVIMTFVKEQSQFHFYALMAAIYMSAGVVLMRMEMLLEPLAR